MVAETGQPAAGGRTWEFDPQGLANNAGATATLAEEDSELLEAVRPEAVCKVWEFNLQGLANAFWAFGDAGGARLGAAGGGEACARV